MNSKIIYIPMKFEVSDTNLIYNFTIHVEKSIAK